MKIIYIHQYFITPEMKGGTRSFEMAKRLVSKGHEVHIISSNSGKSNLLKNEKYTLESGIHVHWIDVNYSNNYSDFRRILSFIMFSILATLKGTKISADIVFATSTPLTVTIPGYIISRYKKIPMVFEVRDLWPKLPIAMGSLDNRFLRWLAIKLETFAYKSSKHIVALSDGMKDGVIETGYSKDQITVIPNSCDIELFRFQHRISNSKSDFRHKYSIPKDCILLIYAGTHGRINGVSYLAKLAKMMQSNKEFYFITIGDGAEFRSIKNEAEALGILGNNFQMLGPKEKNFIPYAFNAADIVLSLFIPLPEMEANSANKFFDGLAAGKCIAINYGGWQQDLLKVYDAGILLTDKLENAKYELLKLLDNKDKIKQLSENAAKLGESKFSRDQLVDNLETVFLNSLK
jgi:glycosyltransferase involved in cell wall biosynthesis